MFVNLISHNIATLIYKHRLHLCKHESEPLIPYLLAMQRPIKVVKKCQKLIKNLSLAFTVVHVGVQINKVKDCIPSPHPLGIFCVILVSY